MIKEYDKVRLKTGCVARISEVLEPEKLYIGELVEKSGRVSVEHILQEDIASVFVEVETPLKSAV
jgi:hypothetical protein